MLALEFWHLTLVELLLDEVEGCFGRKRHHQIRQVVVMLFITCGNTYKKN